LYKLLLRATKLVKNINLQTPDILSDQKQLRLFPVAARP
jgi:hypothetical protein